MTTDRSHEYINEFLYFAVRSDEASNKNSLIYCSGVNVTRFLPITKGRHRPMSNPAMRGLQLVNLGVRAIALSNGATPKDIRGNQCAGIMHRKDHWYKEQLLIVHAHESFFDDIIQYNVVHLIKKILKACCLPETDLPNKRITPDELQSYIQALCDKYGKH